MTLTKQQRKPRYRRLPTISLRLQERDTQIIRHVYKHRFLTSEHIIALVSGSRQGILRRLHVLFHGDYLNRPPEQIRLYQQGTNPMIYALGNKGADLLTQNFKIPRSKVDWTSKSRNVKSIHLEHTLMISHFMVCLELACRGNKNVELIEPEQIIANMPARKASLARAGRPARNRNQINPLSWKVEITKDSPVRFKGKGRNFNFSMVPDKVFGLYFPKNPPSRSRAHFFLEADRTTMPIKRTNLYRSSYLKKLIGYWDSWNQHLYPNIFGFKAVRILTITKSQHRIRNMIQTCKELDPRGIGSTMFLFAQIKDFSLQNPGHILKVWQNSRDSQPTSLIH